MDLRSAIRSVCQKATNSRSHEFEVASLVNAKPVSDAGKKFRVSKVTTDTYKVEVIDLTGTTLTDVPLGSMYGLAGAITNIAFSTSTYGQVKLDDMFCTLYDVKDRNVFYIQNGVEVFKPEKTAPCMICGLVLPVRNMTVDHQRPQSGGEFESILKTFRAFGLTREGPKGEKGKKVLEHLRTGAHLSAVPTQPGRAPLGGASLQDRYSLNDDGTALYSFVAAADKLPDLIIACMHGLMNLQPACNSCNSSRGQQLKFRN